MMTPFDDIFDELRFSPQEKEAIFQCMSTIQDAREQGDDPKYRVMGIAERLVAHEV